MCIREELRAFHNFERKEVLDREMPTGIEDFKGDDFVAIRDVKNDTLLKLNGALRDLGSELNVRRVDSFVIGDFHGSSPTIRKDLVRHPVTTFQFDLIRLWRTNSTSSCRIPYKRRLFLA